MRHPASSSRDPPAPLAASGDRAAPPPGRNFLKISTAPDIFSNGQPNVVEQCFSNLTTRRQADVNASISTLRANLNQLQTGLHQCVHALLKAPGCRERVLQFLAAALKLNMGRAKMQAEVRPLEDPFPPCPLARVVNARRASCPASTPGARFLGRLRVAEHCAPGARTSGGRSAAR